jgi:hypothetical protein
MANTVNIFCMCVWRSLSLLVLIHIHTLEQTLSKHAEAIIYVTTVLGVKVTLTLP